MLDTTPLYSALLAYNKKNPTRFHTPGHKGILPDPLQDIASFDVTELRETGSLFEGIGPMATSEKALAAFYEAGASLISAGGATLCVGAMLGTFCKKGATVLMARGCHRSAVSTAAILDLDIVWIYPDIPAGNGFSGRISLELLEYTIKENPKACAFFVTSPDYFGVISDIGAFSAICKKYDLTLLVDNAHGSHLKFFAGLHPLALGADCSCDSLHKTLPVMTGGAILHLKDAEFADKAREMMAFLGSTSPNYLILLSIELLAAQLPALQEAYLDCSEKARALMAYAHQKNIWATSGTLDPLRIVLAFAGAGQEEIYALCDAVGVVPEYVTDALAVFLLSPETPLDGLYLLADRIAQNAPLPLVLPEMPRPQPILSVRDAMLGETIQIALADCVGRVSAQVFAPCPPGIPIVVPGEKINETTKKTLEIYGATHLFVVK